MRMKNGVILAVLLFVMASVLAQDGNAKYPSMAPLEQYLIADRDREISLARSATPSSISENAQILSLTRHGFETTVKGTNGLFVS